MVRLNTPIHPETYWQSTVSQTSVRLFMLNINEWQEVHFCSTSLKHPKMPVHYLIAPNDDFYFCITKTCLYNFDPLKPHFHVVKLRFTGGILYFFLLKSIYCGYSLEPPRRGASNEYPQSMFWTEIWQLFFNWKFSFVLVVNFSVYLKRHVFVMVPL